MAEFRKLIVTTAGVDLLTHAVANNTTIAFSRVGLDAQNYTDEEIPSLTVLADPVASIANLRVTRPTSETIQITTMLSNSTIESGYSYSSIGLFAKDASGKEVLFAVCSSDSPGDVPPNTSPYAVQLEFQIGITNAKQITFILTEPDIYVQKNCLFDMVYPVGSIYMSANSVDPSVLFGGTWEQLKDRFLLGAGGSYSAGATGGEATHTLTGSEIPNHAHKGQLRAYGADGWWGYNSDEFGVAFSNAEDSHCFSTINKDKSAVVSAYADTGSYGGSSPHNNMPPYLAVYMWKRTA